MNKTLAVIAGIILFLGLLTYFTLGPKRIRAEVCVAFNGRTNCRIASGPTREAAQRAATDNACATIASGMTETMSCGHNPPQSVRWLD